MNEVRTRRALLASLAIVLAVLAVLTVRSLNPGRQPAPPPDLWSTPGARADERATAQLATADAKATRTTAATEEPPRVDAASAAPPARPRGRLKQSELAPLVALEPGRIEVQVLDGETPLPGVPVAICAADAPPPEQIGDVLDPESWSRTDADGLARFGERTPGYYGVRAWVSASRVVDGGIEVHEGRGQRWFLRTGSGVVEGRIHGPDRAPLADARLGLIVSPDRGHSRRATTRSDALGRFRFEGLPSGFYILLHEEWWTLDGARPARARFYLEPGETIAVELGPARAPTVWTGAVRASSGEVVPCAFDVTLDEAEHGNEISFTTDERGRFRVELAPGDYLVGPEGAWGAPGFLRVVVGDQPIERDLVATGVVLHARVAPEDLARSTALHLGSDDGSGAPTELKPPGSSAGADRYWRVERPRAHRLRAQGLGAIRGPRGAELDVDLTGRSGLVTIDVELVPR